jgi:hypothetical protein
MFRKFFSTPQRLIALLIYGIGFLLGLFTAVSMIWPDMEASFFGRDLTSAQRHVERAMPLYCPVFLTPADGSGIVEAVLVNPSDERGARVPARARISDGYVSLVREVNVMVELAPGERKTLLYDIYESDVAYDRFILVRVYAIRSTPYLGGQASCGVWWLNIPWLTGGQLLTLLLLLSAAALAYGHYGWYRAGDGLPRAAEFGRFLLAMTVMIVAAVSVGALGQWFIGALILALAVLILAMSGLIIEHFGSAEQ